MNEIPPIFAPGFYEAPSLEAWPGRPSDPTLGPQYWHQSIFFHHLPSEWPDEEDGGVALMGYACDEGVKRNLGRPGAIQGPAAIRYKLGPLAYHHPAHRVMDVGNILCPGEELENAQFALSEAVRWLQDHGKYTLLLGGGHDMAYGHAKGLLKSLPETQRLGLINFDAHFDLRPYDGMAHSGTPFSQLMGEHPRRVSYLAVGIQSASNPPHLFERAKMLGVSYIPVEQSRLAKLEEVWAAVRAFIDQVDCVCLSLDLDGIAAAYAPGVSAPSPLGMEPVFVWELASRIFTSRKVIACHVAELNPELDQDLITANLAARWVDSVVGWWS